MGLMGNTVGKYLSGENSKPDTESMEDVYGSNNSLLDAIPSMPGAGSNDVPELEPSRKSSANRNRSKSSENFETVSNTRSDLAEFSSTARESIDNLWDSVKESKPSAPSFSKPEYNIETPDLPDFERDEQAKREPDSMLRDRGFQAGLGVGGGYLLMNDLFSHMSEQGGKIGEIGSDALDYTQDVVYRDIADFSQADNFVDTMMSTSDYWIHGIANYGIGKAGCHAVDKVTDEHDPKKTALGGLASVAAFTVFKEGYVQGQDLEFALNNFDTQGDIIMNTAGGLYGIHNYEKERAASGEVETSSKIQEAVNDIAYKLGQKYGEIENAYGQNEGTSLEETIYDDAEIIT